MIRTTRMGRPLNPEEIARFIDAIRQPHLLMFAVITTNALARPSEVFGLRRSDYDSSTQYLSLGPAYTKMRRRRPIPVTPTLHRWLNRTVNPEQHYVTYRNVPVTRIGTAWSDTLLASRLGGNVTPMSFRHGVACELSSRGVDRSDVADVMGYTDNTRDRPFFHTRPHPSVDPHYFRKVIAAVEGLMDEIKARLKVIDLDDPAASLKALERRAGDGA